MFDPFSLPVVDRVALATDLLASCAITKLEDGLTFQEVSAWMHDVSNSLHAFMTIDAPAVIAAEDPSTARANFLISMDECRAENNMLIPHGEITLQ